MSDVSDPETEMIDWLNLLANTFWVLGCALALATLSYASWRASVENEKMGMVLSSTTYKISLYAAGALFSIGLAATSDRIWEILLWTILAILFFIQAGFSIHQKKKTK
ncbi:hypothetical protein ACFLUA_00025 [Chloroflexota bacterium]